MLRVGVAQKDERVEGGHRAMLHLMVAHIDWEVGREGGEDGEAAHHVALLGGHLERGLVGPRAARANPDLRARVAMGDTGAALDAVRVVGTRSLRPNASALGVHSRRGPGRPSPK